MKKLILIVMFFLGFITLYSIDQWHLVDWRSEKQIELNGALTLYQTQLKNTIASRFHAIESLASLFVLHPNTTRTEFDHFAASLLRLNPPMQAIEFADSDTRVIYVYPFEGNEITVKKPMTLLEDPMRGPFVKKAIQEKTTILQGPFKLRQGGTGVAVRFPIFKEKELIGLSIGVYHIDLLANEALSNLNLSRFAFQLKDSQGNVFWSSGKISDERLVREFKSAAANWTIEASWIQPPPVPILPRVLIWVFGLSLLGAILSYFKVTWQQGNRLKKEVEERTRDLSTSNKSLLNEIAERKQAEQALRDSQEYLKAVYEAAENVSFIVTDLAGEDTKILDVSPGTEKIFGYDRDEIIGRKITILHPPEEVKDLFDTYAELKENNKGYSGEAILIRKSKEQFPALFTIFSKFDNRGALIGTIGVSIDITELKKTENALRASELKFSKVFQCAPILMSISSIHDGRYIDVNRAFERVTGYKRDIAIGSTSIELGFVKREDRERFVKEFNVNGRINNIEMQLTCADGTLIDCMYSGELIEVGDKQRLLSIIIDITGQKKIERRLRQAQKMEAIGNLAGGIAHDFNNLLFPIIGMSEMLLEDLPEDSLEYENVKEIFHAGKRAGDLVRQILTFSRQSEHKMIPVRIQNILKEVLKLSRSTIPSNIQINEDIQQDCGLIMADPTQVYQVAMNLITNAFHAVEEKNGTIDIGLKEISLGENEMPDSPLPPGQYARLLISDNGIGMTKSTINNIYDPYFTTKKQGKGTGLGLAVVYGIVKEHKGDIELYSEVGRGTTFNIYLPLMPKALAIVSTNQVSGIATGKENILLVDDEEAIAKLVGLILVRLGYKVTVQTSSIEALKTFRSNPESFNLVISDMTMPNMTGDQLAKEILAIKPDTPIIICSGFSEKINKEKAEVLGIKGFLMKPVAKADMAQMVRKVLDECKVSE